MTQPMLRDGDWKRSRVKFRPVDVLGAGVPDGVADVVDGPAVAPLGLVSGVPDDPGPVGSDAGAVLVSATGVSGMAFGATTEMVVDGAAPSPTAEPATLEQPTVSSVHRIIGAIHPRGTRTRGVLMTEWTHTAGLGSVPTAETRGPSTGRTDSWAQ